LITNRPKEIMSAKEKNVLLPSSSELELKKRKKIKREIAETRDFLNVSLSVCVVASVLAAVALVFAIWIFIAAVTGSSLFQTSSSLSLTKNSFVNFVAKNNTKAASKFSRKDIKNMASKTLNQSSGNVFEVPKYSVQLSEDNYYLGERNFKNKGKVKGFINIYRHKKDSVNNTGVSSNVESDPDISSETGDAAASCATFLARGTIWKGTPEPFSIGYFNPFGISAQDWEDAIEEAMCTWQSELNVKIFGQNNAVHLADGPDYNGPDGKNEIQSAFIADTGILAATTIWGVFDGPIENRYILEADLTFNEQNRFTLNGDANSYSIKNILTHELGHWIGLGDIYDTKCSDATMYGYASKGETKKISLSKIDSDAIRELYGEVLLPYPTNTKCVSPFAGGSGSPGADTPNTPKKSDSSFIKNTTWLSSLLLLLITFIF
jgi:hypothetical protein